jgi:hypothetical protein
MKQILSVLFCLFSLHLSAQTGVDFNQYFHDQTLRIDYYHTGNAIEEYITPDRMYIQGTWAGNPNKLIQPYDLGMYSAKVYDQASKKLIFSTGYSTTFSEYQTTGQAKSRVSCTYHESVLIPFPKHKIVFIIEKRDKNNLLNPIYKIEIDPEDYHLVAESSKRMHDEIFPVVKNGDPHYTVDLVIIGEGYTSTELSKFKNDLEYFSRLLFTIEPFASQLVKFNITGIYTPSNESGTDEPRQYRYRNTALSSSFNIFDSDRYLLTEDNKTLRDIAAQVPYDALLIMVNLDRYGGGGIFDWQTTFATGSPLRDYVFLHEFGHAFAGLADEYYTSDVSYEEFYPSGIEPPDPNITALLDPQNLKWKDLVSPGIEIPTEWGKSVFDSLNNSINILYSEKNEEIQRLRNSGEPSSKIKSTEDIYNEKIASLRSEIDTFLFNHPLKDKIGAFEGAGYQSEGLYRPMINSIMHRFDAKQRSYGKVSERAIMKMIEYYTK